MFNRQFYKKKKRHILVWLPVFLCCVLAAPAMAVEIQVSVELNPTSFTVGATAELTVTVNGTSSATLEIPEVDGLDFQQNGLYQQTTVTGGKVIASVTYNLMVQADKPGDYTIGPVRVKADGKVYTTKSVKCTVLAARNSASQDRDTEEKADRIWL
ncbi:MAG: BatD family protein [Candidatus Electrothrix sp. YB6]